MIPTKLSATCHQISKSSIPTKFNTLNGTGLVAPTKLLQPYIPRLAFACPSDQGRARKVSAMKTNVVKVGAQRLGGFEQAKDEGFRLERWNIDAASDADLLKLQDAAAYLRSSDVPVAFPTETVYGLGADATRTAAVKGIYQAKGRPSDNPLIVHVCDLEMLRELLTPLGVTNSPDEDAIPSIYKPLIGRFWPGPLTILLRSPQPSRLAPEVTAGLPSFGARMPNQQLALSLIKLAGAPLAAPSANASTRPSPTTAQHVLEDLDGKIEVILDGGPCDVGVESTVVDGLCDPPVILRPGGVSMDELRECPGWERVERAYKDKSEVGKAAPRAPGMKYMHYSPKARVVLYESSFKQGDAGISLDDIASYILPSENRTSAQLTNGCIEARKTIGVIRTRRWPRGGGLSCQNIKQCESLEGSSLGENGTRASYDIFEGELRSEVGMVICRVVDIDLGRDIRGIAHGVFSAFRDLDRRGVDIIFVDGLEDNLDIAAAVMNRLRKAAWKIRA